MNNEPLISELIYQKEQLAPAQIMKALIDGHKLKIMKAPKGVNFWLEDGQLASDSLTYLKGIPQTWFNPDIRYEIDYD